MKNIIQFLKEEWKYTLKAIILCSILITGIIYLMITLFSITGCNPSEDNIADTNVVEVTMLNKELIQNNDDRNIYMYGTAIMWNGEVDHVNMFMNIGDTLPLNQPVYLNLTDDMEMHTWSIEGYEGMDYNYPAEVLTIIMDFENIEWDE
jgi:hypothetical protein